MLKVTRHRATSSLISIMSEASYHRSDNAQAYRQNASFVFSDAYAAPVLALLDPQPGDHVLDLGCGK